jgi:hypothetical protein
VTLPKVVTGELVGKFGEVSLFNQHADFELGSASNSNMTTPWAIACELATQPSHVDSPPRERFTRSPRNISGAHTKAPTPRRAGKEIVPDYDPDSDTAPATTRTPTLSPASTRIPHMSSTSGRTLMSPSPRTTPQSNPCQDHITSPEPHRAASMPARRLKNYGAIRLPRQAITTASLPSLRDFATSSSQRNSSLWESPSTT